MRLATFLLVLAAFVQSAFLPINLVLIILVSRSLILDDKSNLYLAFFGGILLGLLMSVNIGFYTLLFIIIVEILRMLRRFAISANILVVPPITFVFLLVISYLEQLFFHQTFSLGNLIVQALLALPIYILVRFWEERFVVAPPLKLKIR